jgi:hypothetical protein
MVTVAAKYTANYASRIYYSRPPFGYDPQKPVALYVWGQGCGQGTGAEDIPPLGNPIITGNATTPGQAVIVEIIPPQPNRQCYSAGPDGDNVDSPELPYYDQIVSEMEAAFCIDKTRVYQGGYSSGGWFSSLMACDRADVVKGVGWVGAGIQKNHAPCGGPVPALIVQGTLDTGKDDADYAAAIVNMRTQNGCGTTSKPWNPTWSATEAKADTSSCQIYDGCKAGFPFVYCRPPYGHSSNTENDTHLTRLGSWKLWNSL